VVARARSSDPLVLDEFRRSPGARWIERSRSLSTTAYSWMKRRVARGLRFGVAARVEDSRGRILLVRMNPASAWTWNWVTPGGGAEPHETPRDAILREIREETNVHVRKLRLWKVYHETLQTQGDDGLAWDFVQYTALWAGGQPRSLVPEEVAEARWFSRLPENTEFRRDWLRPPSDRFRVRPRR
jgi:ADP-ribose pyrophosphatase YjhB (NUDIX family)